MKKTSEIIEGISSDALEMLPEIVGCSKEGILFIDIETTGLSPRNSDLYMIGTGFWENGKWVIRQFFGENAQEEEKVLSEFSDFSRSFSKVVHFNGDRFDIPFLQSKYEEHKLTDPFGTVKDMLFLFANEKYSQLVGKPSAELVGNTYLKTVMNRDEDWIKYSYQAAILRQSSTIRTYNTQHDKWLEYCAVPVYQKGFCAFIIHDITIAKKSEDNRELASNTSKLVIDCATALSSAEFGKGIRKVLKLLGQAIKADRVGIVEVKDKKVVDVREWLNDAHASNLPSRKDFERMNIVDMWDRQLKGKNTIVINDTSIIQQYEEEVYNGLLAGSVSRYIVTTLHDNDEIIGYLVADNYENSLPINVAEVMESVAIFISYDMRNRALTKEMM